MGCGGSKSEQSLVSDRIEKELKEDKKRFDQEVKLLLLGAGESGKSTVAKQMKIIHLNGFSEDEKRSYHSTVHSNVVVAIRTLCDAAKDLNIDLQHKDAAQRVLDSTATPGTSLTKELCADISTLWRNDEGIKLCFNRANEFQLIDSTQYYLDNLDRIGAADYVPTEQDVLRSRAKTTGIIEIDFTIDRVNFKLVDVGGQRSERKKWMHCFEDVTAVLFCVAMSEYDLTLVEDDTTNRMSESLKLFGEICGSEWLQSTSMILFLNKKDLFEEKIRRVDLNVCFPEYQGGKDYTKASQYIEDKFVSTNSNSSRTIYCHKTCATDTDNISKVFNVCKDIVLKKVLETAGF